MKKLVLALGLLAIISPVFSAEKINVPKTNPAFILNLYGANEKLPYDDMTKSKPEVPSANFTSNEKNSLQAAVQYWSNILKRNNNSKPVNVVFYKYNEENADAISQYVDIKGSNTKSTWMSALINGKTVTSKQPDNIQARIRVGDHGLSKEVEGWSNYREPVPLNQETLPNLFVVIAHEIAHALGVSTGAAKYSNDEHYFSTPAQNGVSAEALTAWDSHIRVAKGDGKDATKFTQAAPGMTIKIKDGESGDFDISKNMPYFVGDKTMEALGGKAAVEAKGLVNYAQEDNRPRVFGLPIIGVENDKLEMSHIELRNSYMSHQLYRNWSTFMEAELAALQDIGYDIDRKALFGKSYYLDGITADNTDGFFARNSDGTAYTNGSSKVEYGIGLHIYGDTNKITQKANILSDGMASIGARIDGVENTLAIGDGINSTKINTNGTNSIGILTSYGKNHTVNIRNGSEVIANGSDGIGASFDFGRNMLGVSNGHQGSYIYKGNNFSLPDELKGALVKNFNITGKLEGKKAAINISDNAYVENINVMQGAQIKGDIVSKWNSEQSAGVSVQPPDLLNPVLYTNLNFGLTADTKGEATSTVDKTYSGNYEGNINAQATMKMNVKGGTLTYDKGRAKLFSVDIDKDAKLKGSGSYDLKDKFNIKKDGSYTTNGNVEIKAESVVNSGVFNVGDNLKLNTNVLNDMLTSDKGVLNVGYTDGTVKNGNLTIGSNVDKIQGNMNVASGSLLSAINDKTQSVEIDNYNGVEGSKIAFDLGDIFNVGEGTISSSISQVKVNQKEADLLKGGQKSFGLFEKQIMGNPIFDLKKEANFYYGGKKYIIASDATDKAKLTITEPRTRATFVYGLADAIGDATSANYIVMDGEIQQATGGTVLGDTFEITGSSVDFNNQYSGMILDNSITDGNRITYLETDFINAKIDEANGYKGAITLKNNASFFVDSQDKAITINSTNNQTALSVDNSEVTLLSDNNNSITIGGKIQGENATNINNMLFAAGDKINLQSIDNMGVNQSATNLNLQGLSNNVNWTLFGGTLFAQNDAYIGNGSNKLTFNGGNLNLINNQSSVINLAGMTLDNDTNVYLDLDLKNQTIDRFAFNNTDDLTANANHLNVQYVNFLNNKTALTGENYQIQFVDNELKNTNLLDNVLIETDQEIQTPIFKYAFGYMEDENRGYFELARMGSTSDYRSYNPSVLAAPIAAQVGSYLTQLNTYEQAFINYDGVTALPYKLRTAMKLNNRYASQGTGEGGIITFSPNQIPEEDNGLWFRPYATFENVNLSHGPTVGNVAYGSLFGGDTGIIELKHGWDAVYSAYAGYNGSHQTYDGVGIYQNGGTLGGSALFMKKKFFTGLTANVGANVAQANTMYGHEDFTMLATGVASKTGYNFEFKEGKFIIQPNYLMSYTFVNTFDYNNAAGVDISSSPLNAIQIAPGIKFIGNFKNSWQPYANVQMVWNILDKTNFSANDVALPQMSVQPCIQYGVGLQKRWGDRFTAFGQAMVRNGGRTGIAMQFGFRWALGK